MCQVCATMRPHQVADGDCEYGGLMHFDDPRAGGTSGGAVESGGSVYAQKFADYLNLGHYAEVGYWEDQNWRPFDYSHDADNTLTFNIDRLTAQGQQQALDAFEVWEDVTGLKFVATSNYNDAQLRFDDENSGGYAQTWSVGNDATHSFINVHKSISRDHNNGHADYAFFVMVHEIGHALGLGHTGNYNGSVTWNQREFDNDSMQGSVMSYFYSSMNPNVDANFGYVFSTMVADNDAIQRMYGIQTQTRTGDTVYGVGGNVEANYLKDLDQELMRGAMTLYDDGGRDMLDLSSSFWGMRMDLAPGAISDVMGKRGNLVIDWNTIIEDARGGRGNDHMRGNAADNLLDGGDGNDTFVGGIGNDTVLGGTGDDTLDLAGRRGEYTAYEGHTPGDILIAGGGTTILLRDVEFIRFSDQTVSVNDLSLEDGGDDPIDPGSQTYRLVDMDGDLFLDSGMNRIALLDEDGRAATDRLLNDWTYIGAQDVAGGVRVILRNAEEDLWRDFIIADGTMADAGLTRGAVALARIEAFLGDVDGDGQVAQMPEYPLLIAVGGNLLMSTQEGDLALTDDRGRDLYENTLNRSTVLGAAAIDDGFGVVLRDKDGLFEVWAIDGDGALQSVSKTTGTVALARLEAVFGDLDADGRVAQMPEGPELIVVDSELRIATAAGDVVLTDDRGRPVKDSELRNETVMGVAQTGDGLRLLTRGDRDDVWSDWYIAPDGQVQTVSRGIGDVTLARLESVYGDLDGDGSINAMPGRPELIEVDRELRLSTATGEITLTDDRGRALGDRELRDWTFETAVSTGGGYRILLREEGRSSTLFRELHVDTTGTVTQDRLETGTVALARLESVYGDLDGNGRINPVPNRPELIALDKKLYLSGANGMTQLMDERGRDLSDRELRDLDFLAAMALQDGFRVLLRNDDGAYVEWTVNAEGRVTASDMSVGQVALARLEQVYGDLDGDGALDTAPDVELLAFDRKLILSTADGMTTVVDDRGRDIRDTVLRDWNVLATVTEGDGYRVLLQNRDGVFEDWTVSANGTLTGTEQMRGAMAVARLEQVYGDIDGNGRVNDLPEGPELVVVDGELLLSTETGVVALLDDRGREMKESDLRGLTLMGAVEIGDGYGVLLRARDGVFTEWRFGSDGRLQSAEQAVGQVALAVFEATYGDLDGSGGVNALPADPELVELDNTLWLSTGDGMIALTDTRGRELRENELRGWDAVAAAADGDGFRVLSQNRDGVYMDWTVSGDGTLTGTEQMRGAMAVARLEQVYGDIDGNGRVNDLPEGPELVIVDGELLISGRTGIAALLDDRGREMKEKDLRGETLQGVVADADGFGVLLRDRDGIFTEWRFDANGRLQSADRSMGDVALARFEATYGDLDGSGGINTMPDGPEVVEIDRALQLSHADGVVALTDERGRDLRDRELRDKALLGTVADGDGYRVLLQDEDGQYEEWTFGADGRRDSVEISVGAFAFAGFEAVYGDLDGNGAIAQAPDGPIVYAYDKAVWIETENAVVGLTDARGRDMRDQELRDAEVLGAMETEDGFQFVMQDEDGVYVNWHFDQDGGYVAADRTAGDTAFALLEQVYGDLDGDGAVATPGDSPELVAMDRALYLSDADGMMVLSNTRGREMRDSELRGGEVLAIAEQEDGYRILLENRGGNLKEWVLDANGAEIARNNLDQEELAERELIYGIDLNGDGTVTAAAPDNPGSVSPVLEEEDGFSFVTLTVAPTPPGLDMAYVTPQVTGAADDPAPLDLPDPVLPPVEDDPFLV